MRGGQVRERVLVARADATATKPARSVGVKPARVEVPRSKEAALNLADALRQNRERAVSSLEVSRETLERLQSYADLLVKWQRAINLVASSTLESLWTRHI